MPSHPVTSDDVKFTSSTNLKIGHMPSVCPEVCESLYPSFACPSCRILAIESINSGSEPERGSQTDSAWESYHAL